VEQPTRRDPRQNRRIGTGAGFRPSNLPGCVLWLRADLGITVATGVSTWADQSGNGNNFTQGTGANQPGLAATGNARGTGPALTFNGTTQFLANGSAILGPSNFSLFMVMKTTAPAGANFAAGFGSTTSGGGWTPNVAGSTREVTALTIGNIADGTGTSNWEEWSVLRDSTTWTMSVNGASQSLTGNTTNVAAQQAGSSVGASGSSGINFWTGSIDEVIGYSRKLSAAEQSQIEAYIRARTAIW
jgi:hypothetical protein